MEQRPLKDAAVITDPASVSSPPQVTPIPHLPPLAGICSFEQAQRVGLSVEACVEWQKDHHYLLVRLHQILTARITAEPLFELKSAFSLHAYLCAEHASAIRNRVAEMREPPLGLDDPPDPALELLCDELLTAPTNVELVLGLYEIAIPGLMDSMTRYLEVTNPLADAPSVRLTRFCLLELQDMQTYGRAAVEALVDASARERLVPWTALLRNCVAVAGRTGVSGEQGDLELAPQFSRTPYQYDPVPKRDSRFHDAYNGGVNPEAFLYDDRFVARDKVLMMFYKRLREIDVPEMMAGILHQTPGKPWEYYRDMSRQLWDEARHALMGQVGFVHLGIDWSRIPVNFTWSLNLNTQLEPWERHAVLFFIEQGLMPRTGKRYEWEVAQASGLPLATVFQDFDWADEVLHAQIGREWYVKEFGDLKEALRYGDRCWSKVMSHWREYVDQGLTSHRNWWPDLYQEACKNWQITPDPAALSFQTTYEATRADLKAISASG